MKREVSSKLRADLYHYLFEWYVTADCDHCAHLDTFRDDGKHPCNKCDCCNRFTIAPHIKEDLKEKVETLITVIKSYFN